MRKYIFALKVEVYAESEEGAREMLQDDAGFGVSEPELVGVIDA